MSQPLSEDNLVSPDDKGFSSSTDQGFSSSVRTQKSHIMPKIEKDIDEINVNVDIGLDDLLKHIAQLLDLIDNRKLARQKARTRHSWHWLSSSEDLKKRLLFLSNIIDIASKLTNITEAKSTLQNVLKAIGHAGIATNVLLVAVSLMEQIQEVSANKKECLRLFREMIYLAKFVKQLGEDRFKDDIKNAKEFIADGIITCFSQIKSSGFSRFFSASEDKKKLDDITKGLASIYVHLNAQVGVHLLEDIECTKRQPRLSRGYPEYSVGIEESIREVMDLLEWGSKKTAVAVILYGFGGTGKTTLSDAVFSRLNLDGCRYSMVELSENIDSSKIVKLQKDILKDLTESKDIHEEFRKYEEGQRKLSSKLKEVPAFIYVDNVLDKDHLRQLLPLNYMDEAKHVRLLVTARDINVRRVCRMDTPPKEYCMRGISPAAAKTVLQRQMTASARSLLEQQMPGDTQGKPSSQLQHIIEKCGGIPLMLTFVAQELSFAKDKEEVCDVIEEVDKLGGEQFGEKLESYFFSFHKLPRECKDPFLDICSFLVGWEWDMVADIVGKSALDRLQGRALVSKGTNGIVDVVHVHDVILEIGRRRTEGVRFNFTTARQLLNFLANDDEKVKQLRYLIYKPAKDWNQLNKMPSNLRYMEIDGKLHGDESEYFPTRLLSLPNLKVLKLINFESLKVLPSELANLVNGLRELTLSNCKSLEQLPYSISKLKHLRVLKVDHCERLKALPPRLGKLTSLVKLDLSNCQNLKQLPKDFELLNSVQVLSFKHCESLEALPVSFEKLESLKVLNLSFCKALENLPDGLGNLASLVQLDLSYCESLSSIPEISTGQLSLRVLNLSFCKALKNLPDSLGNLSSLVQLDLSSCQSLSSLPESIGRLKLLRSINISSCLAMKELPSGFCNLLITYLDLTACSRLEKLPEQFGQLKTLRILKLKSCTQLPKLPLSFSELRYLVELDLSGCHGLQKLCMDFHCLLSLQTLSLESCRHLKLLSQEFRLPPSLRHLDLRNCEMLEGECMDGVLQVKKLEMVHIGNSAKLQERWREIRQRPRDAPWPFKVDVGKDMTEEEKKNEWKNLSSKLELLLRDGQGEPFHLSRCCQNTILLVMFDAQLDFNTDFPWPLIEEAIDDTEINFEMIYVGNHFNMLPVTVADKIKGRALHNLDARLLFEWFSSLERNGVNVWHQKMNKYFFMSTKIVQEDNGAKYFSGWQLLSNTEMEEFVLSKCERYLWLKQHAEVPQESSIPLLLELFVNGKEENCFLRKSQEVAVGELKGKRILLEIMPDNERYDIPIQSLTKLYEKERSDLEIISIPNRKQAGKKFDVPWLVLKNPWKTSSAGKYFLMEDCKQEEEDWKILESWYPTRVRIIEADGRIADYKPILRMLDRWGESVYPFTEERIEKVRNEEWNLLKSISCLEFLLKPLEDVSNQVKEVMLQKRMTCLIFGEKDPRKFVDTIKSKLATVGDSIHFIYIPCLDRETKETVMVTHCITMPYFPLKEPKMLQEIEGVSLLNLAQCDAMKFWMRVSDLQHEISGRDEIDKNINEMKRILLSLNHGALLMGTNGEMVASGEKEISDWIDKNRSMLLICKTKLLEWMKMIGK